MDDDDELLGFEKETEARTYVELIVSGRLYGSILRERLDDSYSFIELGFRHGR